MNIPLVDLQSLHKPIEEEILDAVKNVVKSCQFIMGEELRQFEEEFSRYCMVSFSIGTASGSDAIRFCLMALGIGAGDEVITAPNSFIASASPIIQCGATPVFADIEPDNYHLDIKKVEEAISERTKAIIPVHLYGQTVNMGPLYELAAKHNLKIVEDACQAHGAFYNDKRAGALADCAAFSFYPGKNLGAMGDGGLVTTNSQVIAEKIRMLSNYGQKQKYYHDELAFNSRLDSMQAAILRIKLKYLDEWNEQRRQAAEYYNHILRETSLHLPQSVDRNHHVFHLYVVRYPKREQLLKYLQQKGIGAGIHYPIPIHLQKGLGNLGYKKGDFPITEKACDEVLSLPIFPGITKGQQDYIAQNILDFEKSNLPV
ncbi:DegT/DnrJ/EryC1/StrS family aminotransferase [Candidatus Riflebacteria bacterium]